VDKDFLDSTALGKETDYPAIYTPSLLQAIPRRVTREALSIFDDKMPFSGVDIWNAYEVSWLNAQGKPEVAVLEMVVPANSPSIIESKSLKLYLKSFNGTQFSNVLEVRQTLESDLSVNTESTVEVRLLPLSKARAQSLATLPGESLDEQDLVVDSYNPDCNLLSVDLNEETSESLHTDLFRSLCPVTGQPDWASILIQYQGHRFDRAGLLRYLLSFRNHAGFHEQCVERIFMDLSQAGRPKELSVYARFTRRGGIDINPYRTTSKDSIDNLRLVRQ
jgi:7-cyano-7-deazaguanine reductase